MNSKITNASKSLALLQLYEKKYKPTILYLGLSIDFITNHILGGGVLFSIPNGRMSVILISSPQTIPA